MGIEYIYDYWDRVATKCRYPEPKNNLNQSTMFTEHSISCAIFFLATDGYCDCELSETKD